MKKLIDEIKMLKGSELKRTIDSRIREFIAAGKRQSNDIFKELCFCILTANFNAERSIRIMDEAGDKFIYLSEKDMAKLLRKLGHRFPNMRAKFIVLARGYKDNIKQILQSMHSEHERRDWLVKNIKGLGNKEASHFLRNIGCIDCAIVDFHIVDLLMKYGLVKRKKPLSRRMYMEIEDLLRQLARRSGLNLAELDLYLWYKETGKVLK